MRNKSTLFYGAVLALFLIQLLPTLMADGMFMDGLLYASISQQLAHGWGSFWHMHLTEGLYPQFFEHPPLAFFCESVFFRMFGDSIYVERLYALCTALITGGIMVLIWREIVDQKHKSLGWLPLLFWIAVQRVVWSVENNMLENTVMIFVCLSVWFSIKSTQQHRMGYALLAGMMLFLGFLSKGLVALFPLTIYFWMYLFNKEMTFSKMMLLTSSILVGLAVPLLTLYYFNNDAHAFLNHYIQGQVVGSIKNVVTVNSRFFIVQRLFSQHIPAFIILAGILFFAQRDKAKELLKNPLPYRSWMYVFLGLGFSGVLPIMISLKQRGFYIVPVYALFSIALALLVLPIVYSWVQKIRWQRTGAKLFKISVCVLLLVSITLGVLRIGKISRDKVLVADVHAICKVVPEKEFISIHPSLFTQWNLHGYFMRYHYISLDNSPTHERNYLLLPKGVLDKRTVHYVRMNVDLQSFELYKVQN